MRRDILISAPHRHAIEKMSRRVDGVAVVTFSISAQARIRRAARRAGKARAKARAAARRRRVRRKGRVGKVTRRLPRARPKLKAATGRRRARPRRARRKSRRVKFKTTSIRPPFLGRGNSHARDAHANFTLLLRREAHGI